MVWSLEILSRKGTVLGRKTVALVISFLFTIKKINIFLILITIYLPFSVMTDWDELFLLLSGLSSD